MYTEENFRNNIFCRRESNQHKAKKIWEEIKHKVPKEQRLHFEIEWGHYILNEFDADDFGAFYKEIEHFLT